MIYMVFDNLCLFPKAVQIGSADTGTALIG